ncbi:hypothetical protein LTR74_018608, partial [Friedmanniomyces endolithicus]
TILKQFPTTAPDSDIKDKLERTLTLTVSSIENNSPLVVPKPDTTGDGIGSYGEVYGPGDDPSGLLTTSSESAAPSLSSPSTKEVPTKEVVDPEGKLTAAASRMGDSKMVEMLLDLRADVNAKEGSWGSALMTAIACSQSDVAKVLIDHGADARTPGALPKAAGEGLDKIVGWLLDANADVDADDGAALSSAARRWGRMSTARLLLDRGADVKYGDAIHVAISSGHSSLAGTLLQAATQFTYRRAH